jgi:hypothetical protein
MDDRRHLAALAIERRAEQIAARDGITVLQAIRYIKSQELLQRRSTDRRIAA